MKDSERLGQDIIVCEFQFLFQCQILYKCMAHCLSVHSSLCRVGDVLENILFLENTLSNAFHNWFSNLVFVIVMNWKHLYCGTVKSARKAPDVKTTEPDLTKIYHHHFQSLSSWIMNHGSWIMDRGSWIMDRGSWIVDRGSWIMDHELWIMDHES